jgi:uncharacterized protein (DUF342 family)
MGYRDIANNNLSDKQENRFNDNVGDVYGNAPTNSDLSSVFNSENGQNDKDGYVSIELSLDRLRAFIRVFPPQGAGKRVTVDSARAALAEQKIVYGLIDRNLEEAVIQSDPAKKILIAQGKPPIEGEPAKLIYHFSTERRVILTEKKDGKVDFYNLGTVQNVRQGQVLVEKTDPGLGEAGYTVCWEKIQPKPGKDVSLPKGKNVVLSSDQKKILADKSGQVVLDTSGKVSVFPVYEVNGDWDLSIGNVDFVGSVVIRGSVGSGFTIKAEGDIEVYGSVDSSTLIANGNIIIKRGVQGRGKCLLKCSGNLSAMFLENCEVEVGTDVIVQQAIMHSRVLAGRKVLLEGRKGLIVGGTIKAGDEVIAHELGAALATPTEIEVGLNPYLRTELYTLIKDIEEIEQNLPKTKQAIELLKRAENSTGSLPMPKKEMLAKLTRSQFVLTQKLNEKKKRKSEIERLMVDHQKGRLVIRKIVHPGTKITVGNASIYIRDEMKAVIFVNDDAAIKTIHC